MNGPDDTPARLVLAAEELFARGGEEATSLRAISRAARSNAAAVHYHFGGRDDLLRAVVERHLAPLNRQRFALLDAALDAALERHGQVVSVADVVAAVVRPDLELLDRLRPDRVQVARLLGRAPVLPGSAVAGFVARSFDTLAARVVPLLVESCGLQPAEARVRLGCVLAVVSHAFATAGGPDEPGPFGVDGVDDQVRRLVAFCAGGLAAAGTARAKKRKRRP